MSIPQVLFWENDELTLLDQTRLPHETVYETQKSIGQMWQAIHMLKVRGAPAIGVAAAYGCLTGMAANKGLPIGEFKEMLVKQANYLDTSRPTAVNLSRSVKMMTECAENTKANSSADLYDELLALAKHIHAEDIELCRKIGEHGAVLIKDGCTLLTHCNAGALATSGMGTALAPMYIAHEKGVKFKVYADETRPLLQGARLTAWELRRSGIDVTLNCDNMAADLMSRGMIDLIIVGCDRVAANGDTANKIGTLGVAVLAKHYNIPFYVACPSATIDFALPDGASIPIEARNGDEVRENNAEAGLKVYNPAFDVTPAALITGFITEKGIVDADKLGVYNA